MAETRVILSTAMTLDGCIDDVSDKRLLISSKEDMEAVKQLRAECHAIVVGAGTVRKDNPSLFTKSDALRQKRLAEGLPADPVKVVVTRSGDLDPTCPFFSKGKGEKIICCPYASTPAIQDRFGSIATVLSVDGQFLSASAITRALAVRGLTTILVEGGSSLIRLFLEEDMVDHIRLAVAPFILGQADAPRFLNPGQYAMGAAIAFHPVSSSILDGTFVLEMVRKQSQCQQ